MRRDLIFPVVLLVTVVAMAIYAGTAPNSSANAELATVPASCQGATHVARLGALPEGSALATSRRTPNLFWSINDSHDPTLYAVSTAGEIVGRVHAADPDAVDWEAIAAAPCEGGSCLFIGDIGDNERARPTIRIVRVPEPLPTEASTRPAAVMQASYPEGPQDAEALFVAGDSLFIVTKGEAGPVRLYKVPAFTVGTVKLQLVATLLDDAETKAMRPTDAAASPDGRWIAVRSNHRLWFFATAALLAGRPSPPLEYDLRSLNEPQGEGVAWANARTLYLSGEDKDGGTFARLSCELPVP